MKNYLTRTISFVRKIEKEKWILLGFILVYCIYFSYFTFQKHDLFLSGRYDLGNMDQTVWNTLHGRIFTFTNPDLDQVVSRLSTHADFILILFTPLYFLSSNPKILLFTQTIVLALGTLAVYALGKVVLKNKNVALAIGISYLLNPYIQRQNVFEFHAVTLATTFLLAAFYFLERNKTIHFFIFLVLALLTKENIFLIAALMGLYAFFFKQKKWGLFLTTATFIIFYLLVAVFIPAARGQSHFALSYYKALGDSPVHVIAALIENPLKVGQILWTHNGIFYIYSFLLSGGFLSLLSPLTLIFALPDLLINLLSNNPALRSHYYHYGAAIIPFIYISMIYGTKKLLDRLPFKKTSFIVCIYIIMIALISAWAYGPLPGAKEADLSIYRQKEQTKSIQAYLDTLPKESSISATNNIAAHVIHRQAIYNIPKEIGKTKYSIFLITDITDVKDPNVERINQLKNDHSFQVDYAIGNFISFKKIMPL